jgi:catechol 2,3-dioxygenase-like lactoylglutathione lyase family enzyme
MRFKMSPNIAVRTKRYSEALSFYTTVLGFENRSVSSELADLDANPLNMFIIEDDEARGPVLELFVDDLEKAREELVANGCKVLRWRGKGQDCYIEDPFGVIYNIWEQ